MEEARELAAVNLEFWIALLVGAAILLACLFFMIFAIAWPWMAIEGRLDNPEKVALEKEKYSGREADLSALHDMINYPSRARRKGEYRGEKFSTLNKVEFDKKLIDIKAENKDFLADVAAIKQSQKMPRYSLRIIATALSFASVILVSFGFYTIYNFFDINAGAFSDQYVNVSDKTVQAEGLSDLKEISASLTNVDEMSVKSIQDIADRLPKILSEIDAVASAQASENTKLRSIIELERAELEKTRELNRQLKKLTTAEISAVRELITEDSNRTSTYILLFSLLLSVPIGIAINATTPNVIRAFTALQANVFPSKLRNKRGLSDRLTPLQMNLEGRLIESDKLDEDLKYKVEDLQAQLTKPDKK